MRAAGCLRSSFVQWPCSLYRWASVRYILMEGEEERLLAAEPHERILEDARVAIPVMESGRASKAVAQGLAVVVKSGLPMTSVLSLSSALPMTSVLSLMERLRSSTSLIGCLQASTRRRQAREALFNSQVIPSGGSSAIASLISLMPQPGHTCPDVCERRPGGALWFLWEPLAEEGRKALQCRAGGTRFWREEGRSISFGNVGEWPFPLMRGRLFASSDRSCDQGSERGSGNQDLCKTEERSVCACRCCQ